MATPMFDLPEHFPIGVDEHGSGPVDPDDERYERTMCWCADDECDLWRDA